MRSGDGALAVERIGGHDHAFQRETLWPVCSNWKKRAAGGWVSLFRMAGTPRGLIGNDRELRRRSLLRQRWMPDSFAKRGVHQETSLRLVWRLRVH